MRAAHRANDNIMRLIMPYANFMAKMSFCSRAVYNLSVVPVVRFLDALLCAVPNDLMPSDAPVLG